LSSHNQLNHFENDKENHNKSLDNIPAVPQEKAQQLQQNQMVQQNQSFSQQNKVIAIEQELNMINDRMTAILQELNFGDSVSAKDIDI
jgi:CHASE3 domain sensor protein